MKELIDFIKRIEDRTIPTSVGFSEDFVNIMKGSENKSVSRESVKQYLYEQNKKYDSSSDGVVTEDDIDRFMRDLYTEYIVFHNPEHKKQFERLVYNYLINVRNTISTTGVRELINNGIRCYPVTYTDKSYVLGIITRVGHLIIDPESHLH